MASADDAIISQDVSGTITSWNRAAERLFGYTEAEAIGQSIRVIVPPELYEEEDDVLRRVRAGEAVTHFETVRIHKDGQRIDVSLTVSPIKTPDGRIIGVSKIARDITDRRRLERDAQHFAAIVESSDDAIVSKDLNGIIVSWNRAAERMFGYTAAEMIGQSIRRIIPADRQQEEDEVLSRIRRGERVEHYDTIRQRKDGTLVPVSLTVSPIRGQDGTIVGASKIARDISERERAEQERQRLLTIARDASRLKDEFLATLSHELRTPLNAIVGYVRMLQSDLLTGEKRTRAMDTVARNVTSLTQIVEDVLDVSRIISGKLRLDVQPVELAPVIQNAVETVRPAADAKGVRLVTIVDPRTAPVSGDPERLQQILWNVLSNAVKFTERGGRVQVRLERVNSHVEITVSDTGIGIPAEFLPHVFDRFRQADAGINRARGGSASALRLPGTWSNSRAGVFLPRATGREPGPRFGSSCRYEARASQPRSKSASIHRRPRADITSSCRSSRAFAFWRSTTTATRSRSSARFSKRPGRRSRPPSQGSRRSTFWSRMTPDVLLADLGMPQMSGFDLIDRVRRSERPGVREIPAAALTAYARSEDRTKALRRGFQIHLAKPVDPGGADGGDGRPRGTRNPY